MGDERRTYKSGTVFLNDDGRWIAMLELPRRADGRRRRAKRVRKTEADAIKDDIGTKPKGDPTGDLKKAESELQALKAEMEALQIQREELEDQRDEIAKDFADYKRKYSVSE